MKKNKQPTRGPGSSFPPGSTDGAFSFSAPQGSMEQVGKSSFLKDVITSGRYVQEDQEIQVDEARQDKWMGAFFSMLNAGVKVPIYSDHGDDTEAERLNPSERTKGYLTDMFRKNDTLYAVHEFANEDAATMALGVDQVSVRVQGSFTDGKGRNHGEAITHVTLTPKPVVPGQKSFIPLSFSRVDETQEPEKMDAKVLEALKVNFGIKDDLTEENLVELLTSAHTQVVSRVGEMEEARTVLEASLESATKKAKPSKLQPELLETLQEGIEAKMDTLVELSRITPATKNAFLKVFAQAPVQAIMLSRTASKTDASIANQIIDVLKENDVVQTGEKTKLQAVELARKEADQRNADTADTISEMIAHVDGPAA